MKEKEEYNKKLLELLEEYLSTHPDCRFIQALWNLKIIDNMLVGQLVEILKQYDFDREVYIHTLSGETVLVQGFFIQGEDDKFYITDLRVEPIIYDKK